MNKQLREKMEEEVIVNNPEIYSAQFTNKDISLAKIRDYLQAEAVVLEENISEQYYMARMKSGILNLECAIVCVQLLKDGTIEVTAYSNNKLSNKGASKETVEKIIDELQQKKHKKDARLLLLIAIVLGIALVYFMIPESKEMKATKQYNNAVEDYNETLYEYNEALERVDLINLNLDLEMPVLNKVSEDKKDIKASIKNHNSLEQIETDIQTVKAMNKELERRIQLSKQLYQPKEQWIEDKLSNNPEIVKIEHVSKGNDPMGLLDKDGGYISCTYFTLNAIEKKEKITSSIKIGTKGGGAIEVYKTKEDAQTRCDYLSQFDDTIIYSGSYATLGTMVIRTSYLLSPEQQYTLTSDIFEEFTKIE